MFNKKKIIKIKDFLENDYAHNPDIGEAIGNYILENNKELKNIELDFDGIKTMNTAFCNALLSKLYDTKYIENNDLKITIVKYNDIINDTFKKVINNVKEKKDNDS